MTVLWSLLSLFYRRRDSGDLAGITPYVGT
jgi:hypothetical protein